MYDFYLEHHQVRLSESSRRGLFCKTNWNYEDNVDYTVCVIIGLVMINTIELQSIVLCTIVACVSRLPLMTQTENQTVRSL